VFCPFLPLAGESPYNSSPQRGEVRRGAGIKVNGNITERTHLHAPAVMETPPHPTPPPLGAGVCLPPTGGGQEGGGIAVIGNQ
jgi:hypothetical protein